MPQPAKPFGEFPKTKLRPLEFQIRQKLRGLDGATVLIACSGGADSVALLHVFKALSKPMKLSLTIGHVHHGASSDPKISEARSVAQDFVEALAARLELPFLTNREARANLDSFRLSQSHQDSAGELGPESERESASETEREVESQSESALRKIRKERLKLWQAELGAETRLAFGHHRDDLLETRLIRLIRGTGAKGLKAMRESQGLVLRPLLSFSREEIRQHLKEIHEPWLEDPSNTDARYLRNWIRSEWLPQLEAIRHGGVKTLGESLESLARTTLLNIGTQSEKSRGLKLFKFDESGTCFLDLVSYRDLSRVAREQALAEVLAALLTRGNVREYKKTHVGEILKRLDTAQKVHSFSLLGLTWEVIDGRLRIVAPRIR